MPRSEVYNLDCLEALRTMPPNAVDLAIVDPPYGIGADNFRNGADASKDGGKLYSTAVKMKNRALNTSDCSWDMEPPGKEYFDELFRVSRNQIIWGGNYFDLPPTRGIIVWDKIQPWDNFSQVEMAWTSFDRPAALFRMCNTMPGKIHPTQKPVALYEWLLKNFAKPGDTILDTHMGSQSSRIAAYNLNFDYIGYEIDETYFRMGCERFEEHTAQMNLFIDEIQMEGF